MRYEPRGRLIIPDVGLERRYPGINGGNLTHCEVTTGDGLQYRCAYTNVHDDDRRHRAPNNDVIACNNCKPLEHGPCLVCGCAGVAA